MWKCTECGGTNVEWKIWVNANTGKSTDTGTLNGNDVWCQDCEDHNDLEWREEG